MKHETHKKGKCTKSVCSVSTHVEAWQFKMADSVDLKVLF